ncbi:hypothetical protein BDQ12DRAFT_682617 [Crucibulum laeve]|uniref:Uncharacterized protein n=1 Tax=Crucibulum laeve TaxID=68775 RepID=A0A5C3M3C0_9AGAR|nr:hypothetical protein BDQ12DRAFT_682617 [Crucibulum laeve]
MVAEVPLVSVNLATVCIESFLYGTFFILFVTSLYLLAVRQKTTNAEGSVFLTPLVFGSILIFITITSHWICTFLRLFQAFVTFNRGTTPLEFYADLTQTSEVVKTGFLMASLVIGDAMIIYRLWIVWSYNRLVIIFPICTLMGLTACGVGITYQFTQYKPGENVFLSVAGRWITSDCVFTLCTNVYSTIMIAYRVWNVNVSSKKFGGANLNSVLGIVVESAVIYTSWTIFFFASYQSESNLQFIAVDAWSAMSGIAFMFINVRVGLGWAQKANPESSTHHPSVGMIASRVDRSGGGNRNSFAMRPLAVNITRVVDKDSEYPFDEHSSGDSFIKGSAV